MFQNRIDSIAFALAWALLIPGIAAFGQGEYKSDDSPTALEEEIRWLANRGRFDSASENAARQTSYSDVPATAPPLAPHQSLTLASRHHSEDMGRRNIFQHETVPGSAYYNPTTQPTPWDRMEAEGYAWNGAGENIAAGHSTALAAYVGWWKSTGHRKNMYDASLREIGTGYFSASGSQYTHYYTMDLGRSGSTHFLTDTVFEDRDGDGSYDQGEGVAGVRVTLKSAGADHASWDVSSSAGSFAIPIQAISDGGTVEVWLQNTTLKPVALDIPRTYSQFTPVDLAAGESRRFGSFTQPTGSLNVGFRNIIPSAAQPPAIPTLLISPAGTSVELRWPSEVGVLYQPQGSVDLVRWTNLNTGELAGTGSDLRILESGPAANRPFAYYRVAVRRP